MKRFDDVWDGCPEGEVRRLVSELRLSHQRLTMAYVLATLAVSILAATAWATYRYWGS